MTLRANVADVQNLGLQQRVMRDVSKLDTGIDLFGTRWTMPAALAPIGMGGMMARRAEVQAVRAADAFGIPFTLSTVAICSLEEVAKAAQRPFWFQLYMLRDRELVLRLLERAWQQGVRVLAFRVDLAVEGVRHRDVRHGMVGWNPGARLARAWEILSHPRWVWEVGLRGKPHDFGNLRDILAMDSRDLNAYKAFIAAQFDPRVTWKDIAWLRGQWHGRILIKGVLGGEDARHGLDE